MKLYGVFGRRELVKVPGEGCKSWGTHWKCGLGSYELELAAWEKSLTTDFFFFKSEPYHSFEARSLGVNIRTLPLLLGSTIKFRGKVFIYTYTRKQKDLHSVWYSMHGHQLRSGRKKAQDILLVIYSWGQLEALVYPPPHSNITPFLGKHCRKPQTDFIYQH